MTRDLRDPERDFADEVTEVLHEEIGAPRLREIDLAGDGHDAEVHALLGSKGWIAGPWPTAAGGGGWDAFRASAFRLGLRRAGYAPIVLATSSFVGHTLLEFGNDFQRAEIVGELASGSATVCLGYTEPDSGSDVMAARTRAVRDGDDWIIDGTKMFTTGAHVSTYCFLLTRTDPEAKKHAGLTTFLVPMSTPGIHVDAVHTISDERSNAVFYEGVRIPDRYRVGPVNGAVKVLAYALTLEQGTTFVTALEELHDALFEWAYVPGPSGIAPVERADVRSRLGALETDIAVSELLQLRGIWRHSERLGDEGRGPMSKLFSSERLIAHAAACLGLVGADAVLSDRWPFERLYRYAQGTAIYAGTSEILRSRIAETGLGLARSRAQ